MEQRTDPRPEIEARDAIRQAKQLGGRHLWLIERLEVTEFVTASGHVNREAFCRHEGITVYEFENIMSEIRLFIAMGVPTSDF